MNISSVKDFINVIFSNINIPTNDLFQIFVGNNENTTKGHLYETLCCVLIISRIDKKYKDEFLTDFEFSEWVDDLGGGLE